MMIGSPNDPGVGTGQHVKPARCDRSDTERHVAGIHQIHFHEEAPRWPTSIGVIDCRNSESRPGRIAAPLEHPYSCRV
jgi:hypothetical protein